MVIKDGELKFKNYPLILNEISGNIDLNRTLYTDSLYFKINDNDFLLKGRISKLFEYFNEKDIFNINAEFGYRFAQTDQLDARMISLEKLFMLEQALPTRKDLSY